MIHFHLQGLHLTANAVSCAYLGTFIDCVSDAVILRVVAPSAVSRRVGLVDIGHMVCQVAELLGTSEAASRRRANNGVSGDIDHLICIEFTQECLGLTRLVCFSNFGTYLRLPHLRTATSARSEPMKDVLDSLCASSFQNCFFSSLLLSNELLIAQRFLILLFCKTLRSCCA